jgi:porin
MNLVFSTGSAAIDMPNDGSLGVAAAHIFDNNWFVIGSLMDRNGDPTDIGEGFDTFFDDNEYFTSIEIGKTTSPSRIALDNFHITLWHVDEREKLGAPDGWGANVSWTRYYGRFMPFIRAGYTDDTGSLLEKSVSVGFAFQPFPKTSVPGDLIGLGVNWGELNETSFGSGLDDQYTAELFYRWQLTPRLALTGDLQYLRDPALNPDEDNVFVWSLRGRFAL